MVKKKFKLASLFVAGLFIILILITFSFSLTSINNVEDFGNYIVKVDKNSIRNNSGLFFMEIARRTALEHSVFFEGIADIVMILSRQIHYEINRDNLNIGEGKLLTQYKDTNFFINAVQDNDISNYFWGKPETFTNNIKNQIKNVNDLEPIYKKIYEGTDYYIENIWFCDLKNKFVCIYPKNDIYKIADKRENLIKDYTSLKRYNYENRSLSDQQLIMTFPYKDIVSEKNVISLYYPIKNNEENLIGFFGVDVDLEKILNSIKRKSSTYAKSANNMDKKIWEIDDFVFLINKDGDIIYFPDEYAKIFDFPSNYDSSYLFTRKHFNLLNSQNQEAKQLFSKMVNDKYGKELITLKGKKYIIAFSGIKATDWILGYVKNEDSLMLPAYKTENEMFRIVGKLKKFFIITSVIFFIFSLILAISVFKVFYLNPLQKIKDGISEASSRNFNINLKLKGALEITRLAEGFNALCREIVSYTENLKIKTQERQAAETEIKIAREVQDIMLPKITPEFIRDEFDLYAFNNSSSKGSCGFYDFFYINDETLVLIFGSVAKAGISASFFMSMSKVTLKNYSLSKNSGPGDVLEKTNTTLFEDNDAGILTDALIAFYNIRTGTFVYSNAGNINAFTVAGNGIVRNLKTDNSFSLGSSAGVEFMNFEQTLDEKSILFIFSDSVVNNFSEKNYEQNKKDLENYFVKNISFSSKLLCDSVSKKVAHTLKKKYVNDISMLMIKRKV